MMAWDIRMALNLSKAEWQGGVKKAGCSDFVLQLAGAVDALTEQLLRQPTYRQRVKPDIDLVASSA